MLLKTIVNQINKLISNSSSFQLPYDRLEFYIDSSIDIINGKLRTTYRTPKQLYEDYELYYNTMFLTNYLGQFSADPTEFNTGDIYYNVVDKIFKERTLGQWLEYNPENTVWTGTFGDRISSEKFNYNEIPDHYIRQCVIYQASALYLEEEDETETQYMVYKNKAELELENWLRLDYSMFVIPDPIVEEEE